MPLHSRWSCQSALFLCRARLHGHLADGGECSIGWSACRRRRDIHAHGNRGGLADFPFGAIIVHDGTVMARGHNLGRTNQDPTAHGEMVAIRKCLAEHGPAALRGTTLYTSGEPCAMCMGAILWCHVGR